VSRKRPLFSGQHGPITQVADYYNKSSAALELYFADPSPFVGYTKAAIYQELRKAKATLDRMCALELLTALEAWFRMDHITRAQAKLKDPLSRTFRAIYDQKNRKASLENDIIKAWKQHHPEHKPKLDSLQRVLGFRHWLAHGRYWDYLLLKYDYRSIDTRLRHLR
jgi:hypothetical protein